MGSPDLLTPSRCTKTEVDAGESNQDECTIEANREG